VILNLLSLFYFIYNFFNNSKNIVFAENKFLTF